MRRGTISRWMSGAALVFAVAATGQAQTTVGVSTQACFRSMSDPACVFNTTAANNTGLSFTGGAQTPVTAMNGTPQTIELGTVHVAAPFFLGSNVSINQPFTLETIFTQPIGAVPGSVSSPARINGLFLFSHGLYDLNFTGNSVFTIAYNGGTFDFNVDQPASISQVGDIQLTGTISNVTTTPEPGSMALLGTGLVGLVPMVRRRRK